MAVLNNLGPLAHRVPLADGVLDSVHSFYRVFDNCQGQDVGAIMLTFGHVVWRCPLVDMGCVHMEAYYQLSSLC